MRKIIIVIFLIFITKISFACDCPGPGSVEEEFEGAHVVFSGQVIDTVIWDWTIIKVNEVYKGNLNDTVEIKATGMCGYVFEKDKDYLVYAFAGKEGQLEVSAPHCGRTTELEHSNDDLNIIMSLKEGHDKAQLNKEAREKKRGLWRDEEVVKREGLYKEYYKSGELKGEGNWKNGKPHGEFKIYWKTGDILKTMNYKEGKLDGVSKTFFGKDVLKREELHQEGTRLSDKSFYDGKLRLIREYKKNKLIREVEYDKEGNIISEEGKGE